MAVVDYPKTLVRGLRGSRSDTSSATDAADPAAFLNHWRESGGGNAFPGGPPAVLGKPGLLMPEVWRTVGAGGRRSGAGLPQHRCYGKPPTIVALATLCQRAGSSHMPEVRTGQAGHDKRVVARP